MKFTTIHINAFINIFGEISWNSADQEDNVFVGNNNAGVCA